MLELGYLTYLIWAQIGKTSVISKCQEGRMQLVELISVKKQAEKTLLALKICDLSWQ